VTVVWPRTAAGSRATTRHVAATAETRGCPKVNGMALPVGKEIHKTGDDRVVSETRQAIVSRP